MVCRVFTAVRMPLATTCVLLISPGAVYGQHYVPEYDPFYAGVTVGLSDVEDRYLGIEYGDAPWTLQATAGYRFDWIWSVEAAWQTLGDVEANDVRGSGIDRLDFTTNVDSASLRVRLWFPASDLYNLNRPLVVYGFAGVHASDIARSATELTSESMFGEEETDYGLNIGAGVVIGLGRFNLRGSVERIDLDSSDGSIVSAMVGIEFYF